MLLKIVPKYLRNCFSLKDFNLVLQLDTFHALVYHHLEGIDIEFALTPKETDFDFDFDLLFDMLDDIVGVVLW